MNIGSHLLNSYDTNLQGQVRAEQNKATGKTASTQQTADITGLKEGAVFKGEILDVAGEKVTIALENQQKLLARLSEGIELGVGDRLLFSVKENNNNQVFIKPMFDSLYSAQTQTLEKALDAAGLSATEKNYEVAKELMDAGMPVDKGSMVKILSQSMKYPDASFNTLVSLNKMNIPVTEENIAQFERYQNLNHQFMGDVTTTAEGVAEFVKAFPQGTSAETLLAAADELLSVFQNTQESGEDVAITGDTQRMQSELNEQTEGTLLKEPNVKQESTLEVTMSNKDNVTGKEVLSATSEQIIQSQNFEDTTELQHLTQNQSLHDLNQLSQDTANRFELPKEDVAKLVKDLQKTDIPLEVIKEGIEQADSPVDLLKNVNKMLTDSNEDATVVRNVLESKVYKKLLSTIVKNEWSIDPKEMKDPKEIDDLYNKILRQTKAVEDAIHTKGGDSQGFQESSQNMRQNMHFMEQLNQQMIYAQMPLKLTNQDANSELFVYADKKKLAEKKDGIGVLLHLDMDHLGATDIKVTLTGNHVNARFYFNDQQSVDIISAHMKELETQLADRGFSLTNEVVKRKNSSANQVINEIIDENAEKSIKRYTFDVKM